MLKVKLTDGTTNIIGIEYEPVSQLKSLSCESISYRIDTPPGTKVMLTNPEFYHGRLLLRPSCITILGGIVKELYDLWKSQEVVSFRMISF